MSTALPAWAWQHGAQPLFPSGERGLDCRRNQLLPPSRVGAGSALCSLLYILNESHVFYAARSLGKTCAHYITHTADGKNWQGSSKGGQGPGKGRHKLGPTTSTARELQTSTENVYCRLERGSWACCHEHTVVCLTSFHARISGPAVCRQATASDKAPQMESYPCRRLS